MDKSEKLYNEKIDQVIWKTIVSDTVTPYFNFNAFRGSFKLLSARVR